MKKILTLLVLGILLIPIGVHAQVNEINMTIPNNTIISTPNQIMSRQLTEISEQIETINSKLENVSEETTRLSLEATSALLLSFREEMRIEFNGFMLKFVSGVVGSFLFAFAVYEILKSRFSYKKTIRKDIEKSHIEGKP